MSNESYRARPLFVIITLGFMVSAFIVGCSKQNDQASLSNLKPVVGAFGWKLGDKLPEQLKSEVHNGHYGFRPEKEMQPFDSVELQITEDGRIYCIQVTGYAPDHNVDPDTCKNAIISLLTEKYGRRPPPEYLQGLGDSANKYFFGTDDQIACLDIFEEKLFTLEYTDTKLKMIAYDEQEVKKQKAENEKKAALSKGL